MSSYAPTGADSMLQSVFTNTALRCEKDPINTVYVLYSLFFFLLIGISLGQSWLIIISVTVYLNQLNVFVTITFELSKDPWHGLSWDV